MNADMACYTSYKDFGDVILHSLVPRVEKLTKVIFVFRLIHAAEKCSLLEHLQAT